MRVAKKYGRVLFAVMFLTLVFTKNVWADDVPPEETVSGSAITEAEVPEETVSGPEIIQKEESVETVPEPEVIKKPKAAISHKQLQLKVKKTKKLSVSHYDGKIKWSSSKKAVAKVSKNGLVTALSAGDTVIIAQAGKKKLKCKVRVVESTRYINKWVEKKGRVYYYGKYGTKCVGKKKIDGKDYFFDSEGRQRVGWVKSKGKYYYYNIGKKAKGYRAVSTNVNGIPLDKNGEAKLTDTTRDKADYLVAANEICFDYVNFNMTKTEALKKMYTLMAKGEIISYYNYGDFKYSENWDQYYASYYFNRGIGDCYTTGCAFAYIATALGYKEVYAESSGGHGWCRIGDKYYDPNWASWGAQDIYDGFAATEAKSGKDGRVNWMRACKYSKKVS